MRSIEGSGRQLMAWILKWIIVFGLIYLVRAYLYLLLSSFLQTHIRCHVLVASSCLCPDLDLVCQRHVLRIDPTTSDQHPLAMTKTTRKKKAEWFVHGCVFWKHVDPSNALDQLYRGILVSPV